MAVQPLVGIIMGSKSDMPVMEACTKQLEELGVPYELVIASAHRTPDKVHEWASSAADGGIKVIIAEDRKSCVAIGTGKSLDILDKLESNSLNRRAPYL